MRYDAIHGKYIFQRKRIFQVEIHIRKYYREIKYFRYNWYFNFFSYGSVHFEVKINDR